MRSSSSAGESGGMAQLQAHASPFRDLGIRLISAAVMLPAAFAAVWFGGPVFDTAVVLITGLLAWEAGAMCGLRSGDPVRWLLILAIMIPPVAEIATDVTMGFIAMAGCALAVLLIGVTAVRRLTLLAPLLVLYLAGAGVSAIWLRAQPDGWPVWVLLLVIVVTTDVGAYITGRLVGGPKLAPAISPAKTWSGAVGALAASMGAAALFAMGYDAAMVILLPMVVVLSISSQIGDLFESWLKRRAGIKDSGNMIPGHGGVFDRLDGFLAAVPALTAMLALMPLLDLPVWR